MPALKVTAPAKTILFGEHAVVYGFPAIAIPVTQLKTTVSVYPIISGKPNEILIEAPAIGLSAPLMELPHTHPFFTAFSVVSNHLGLTQYPACRVRIHSTVPMASGLGSSASLSVGLVKAFSQFIGALLPAKILINLSYQVETIYHGTPSGIDNTVIGYERGILFQKEKDIQFLEIPHPFHILIANSGIPGKTREAVEGVRKRWEQNQANYNHIFTQMGTITRDALKAFKKSDKNQLGQLMNHNHQLLRTIGVSHPKLDKLVETALKNGAFGAKLCGGGLGGNMIALIQPHETDKITAALQQAGATHTYLTTLERYKA